MKWLVIGAVNPTGAEEKKRLRMKKSYYDQETRLQHFMTLEQEYAYYNEVLQRVILNPRFYLRHLDELDVFEVSFIDYRYKKRVRKRIPL